MMLRWTCCAFRRDGLWASGRDEAPEDPDSRGKGKEVRAAVGRCGGDVVMLRCYVSGWLSVSKPGNRCTFGGANTDRKCGCLAGGWMDAASVLLFTVSVCCAWPACAVETPKHGLQRLGQHAATEAKREETALLMAPSGGQTGKPGAMIRNGG